MAEAMGRVPVADLSACFPDFDRRLNGYGPVGVAVSGGGDSVALLYALAAWGKRPLEVFCVDHGLNPLSRAWTADVARHAADAGAGFTALAWQGDKPATGLSAAARAARHRLLADAARAKGMRVLCLGHTRDDVAEAERMRQAGSNVGAPQAWAPSPAWPEGRCVFLYRPFLDIRREALRDVLRDHGVNWIDDPANENPRSLRARARKTLAAGLPHRCELSPLLTREQAEDLVDTTYLPYGLIAFRAIAFATLPPETTLKLLSLAAVCAGGGDRLPRRHSLENLQQGLSSGKIFNLCGSRLRQTRGHIEIVRETGDIGRNGPSSLSVDPGEDAIWDGRFAIAATASGTIVPSAGLGARLDNNDRKNLAALPAALRGGQPVWTDGQGFVLATNAALRQTPYNKAMAACWVGQRFAAAAGLYRCESDLVLPPDGLRL